MSILGAENLARRFLAVRGQNLVLAIILADYVESVCKSIVVIMTDVRPKERLRDRARPIAFVERSNQRSKNLFCQVSLRSVMNFISGAVDNYARVVAIAAHGIAHVSVGPLFEIQMIVIRIFRHSPAVEQLIHHQKTHPIAQIQKLRSRRIMSSTNCIYAELLECLQAAFPRTQWHGGAERARVVVQADPSYFEVAAVEPETRVSIEVIFTNAERHNLLIDSCSSVAQSSHSTIKVRMLQVPALRILKRDVLSDTHRRACVDILRLGFGRLYHSPAWIEHLNLDEQCPRTPRLIDDFT